MNVHRAMVELHLQGTPKYFGRYEGDKSVTIPLYPQEILHELACSGARACVVQFRKQTAIAVAHPPFRL